MNEKIGIGINVWNGEKTITKTLMSLINQTYQNIEIFILDNQSTDKTVKKIKKLIGKNKKKRKIKLIIDKKKKNIPDAQNFILKKYLYRFKYSMIANDDDIYNKEYVKTLYNKIKKSKVEMVYSFKNKIDENEKILYLKNYPTYGKKDSYFINTFKFLIYREHYKISFGIYETKKYLEVMKYSKIYDSSKVNWDNVSMIYFLLNYRVDFSRKILFFFFEKNRSQVALERDNKFSNTFISLFKIFVYQLNFSKKIIPIILRNKKVKFLYKLILVITLIISSIQKSVSYVLKFFIKKILKFY